MHYANTYATKASTTTQHLPSKDNEHVQFIPSIGEICHFSPNPHGSDLDEHLDGEEGEDKVIKVLEDLAAERSADNVIARLVHTQGNAVEQNHSHAKAFKPSEEELRNIYLARGNIGHMPTIINCNVGFE